MGENEVEGALAPRCLPTIQDGEFLWEENGLRRGELNNKVKGTGLHLCKTQNSSDLTIFSSLGIQKSKRQIGSL